MDKRLTDFLASVSSIDPKLLKYPLVAYMAIAPLVAILFGSVTGALVLVLAGFAGLLFIRAEDITELKFLSLQAKMEKSIKEANATISQLRTLASTLTAPVVTQLALAGELVTHETMPSKQRKINELATCLKQIGVTDKDIDELLFPWKLMAARHVLSLFHQRLNSIDKAKAEPIDSFWKSDTYRAPQEIVALLDTIPTKDVILISYKDLCGKLSKSGVIDDPLLFEVAELKAISPPENSM